MATNLKGQGGIKGLLLLHGEKVAIAIVALVAIWFVYSSTKLPKLDDKFQADKLKSEISQARNDVQQYSWEKAVAEHPDKVKKVVTIEANADPVVKTELYADAKRPFGVDNPIVAPMILRTDPVLLNAVDVRATGGSGLFAIVDEEIRKKQELARKTEEDERARKEEEKRKKAEKAQKEAASNPGRHSKTEGPGEGISSEPVDPAHPRRRMVQGAVRPMGVPTQGGERIEPAYWACVVAKVPIREQLKLYEDAFLKARGYDAVNDFPKYVGFYVERAEVLPGKELAWAAVPLYDGQRQSIAQNKPLTMESFSHVVTQAAYEKLMAAAQQFWSGGVPTDVVDDRYAEYPLTLPLPPLVGRDFGAEASHPDIPWGPNTPPLEEEPQQQGPQATNPLQPAGDANSPFAAPVPAQPGPGGFNTPGSSRPSSEFGAGPGSTAPRRTVSAEPGAPGMTPARPSAPGGVEGLGAARGAGHVAPQHTTLQKGVDFYLLRFFDFSVEPGKKYKYRVKLLVWDPNFGMPSTVLSSVVQDRQMKEAAAAKAKNMSKPFYREVGSFSDPSPTVGIPMAGNVRLADAKIPPADKPNDEPSLKMMVEAIDVDSNGNAIQGYPTAEKDLRRGYVANSIEDADYLVENGTMIDVQPNFKFFTGMTILDVDGGTKLSKDMTVPVRVLIMGPAGELYIRNEIDDKPVAEYHHQIFTKPDPKHPGPGGPGGPGAEGPGGPGRPQRQPPRRPK